MLPPVNMTRLVNQLASFSTWQRPLTFSYLSRSYQIQRHIASLCKHKQSIAMRDPTTKWDIFGQQPLTYAFLSKSHKRNSSSLYMSDKIFTNSYFEFDYDLDTVLNDLEKVKQNVRIRGIDVDVDGLVRDYRKLAELKQQRDALRMAQKATGKKYKKVADGSGKFLSEEASKLQLQELVDEGKQTKKAIADVMSQWYEVEERMMLSALDLPNDTLPSVPEEELEVIQEFNSDRKFNSDVDPMDVMREQKWMKASNLGPRSYFLTGRLAVLEQELLHRFVVSLRGRGFTQLSSPDMFKAPVVESVGLDWSDRTRVYKMDMKTEFVQDDMFLHGSSRMSFLAFLARMIVQKDQLPMKLFNVGRNYVPKSEERSRLPGLYGALQTMKVDICGVCTSREDSVHMFENFQWILADLYHDFNLPFRLVSLPVTSLMASEQNRLELQIWVPSLQQYLKIASLSSLGDYSSRRLMVRYAGNDKKSHPVHTIHGEVGDIMTLISVLVEYDLIQQT